MRTFKFLLIGVATLSLASSCKFEPTKSFRSKPQPLTVVKGEGNGLNLKGTGFVWEKTELPVCYSARNGVKFFVWKEQATFACNKGKKDWQLVAKKG